MLGSFTSRVKNVFRDSFVVKRSVYGEKASLHNISTLSLFKREQVVYTVPFKTTDKISVTRFRATHLDEQLQELATAHHSTSSIAGPTASICVPITATTVSTALKEISEAQVVGADIVELRLDYLEDLDLANPEPVLTKLLGTCKEQGLPAIVTLRPEWEGGKFGGNEAVRLAILKYASTLQPAYIDVEFLAADFFFAGTGTVPIGTNVILSHHDYEGTPTDDALDGIVAKMYEAGADIAKVATTANDISDSMRMLQLAQRTEGAIISLAMGEKGLPSRLLAFKFGSHLTFGSLSADRGSAPGQISVKELRQVYRLPQQQPVTKVFGVIGNPVAHSRSPALHNAALAAAGINAIYLPLLVDDLRSFLAAFSGPHFSGFSVTIPHKLAALEAADEVDPLAEKIGAVNTLVRQADGRLKGFNTDWSAAVEAVETALASAADCDPEGCALDLDSWDEPEVEGGPLAERESPLKGQRVVVLGAGGAGKALAFGAASRGAHVVVANRSREKAKELVQALGQNSEVADLEEVASGKVAGQVLLNSTSVGMQPNSTESPLHKSALPGYRLVFDAVYTPMETQLLKPGWYFRVPGHVASDHEGELLLKDAEECGCLTVSGLEMFVGQAAQQFELFTGQEAPLQLMRQAVLDSL